MREPGGAAGASSQPASLSLLLEPVSFVNGQQFFIMDTASSNSNASSQSEEQQQITSEQEPLPPVVNNDSKVNNEDDSAEQQVPTVTTATKAQSRDSTSPTENDTNVSHLSVTTGTGNTLYSTGNTLLHRPDQAIESVELDTEIIMRELAAMQNNGQQMPLGLPVELDSDILMTGLKPESDDPFLFGSLTAADGQIPANSSPTVLDLTTQRLPMTITESPFDPSLPSAGLMSHQDEGQSPFNLELHSSWNIEDFMGTPVALPPAEMPELHSAMHQPQHPHFSKMLDDHGRRRSQSMPPPGVFTFRRKMEDGRIVNIAKGSVPHDSSAPSSQHLTSAAASAGHGFRHHPYERNGDGRGIGTRGRSGVRTGPTPRSYPTTPSAISPPTRPVSLMGMSPDRMSLDEYHNPALDHHYRSSPTTNREEKRQGRGASKKAPPQPNLRSPHRQELESLAMPIILQLDAVKGLILQHVDELTINPPDELEV